ncbi:MAG: hypothetical protein IPO26_19360 [Saprospiraceae bacterium]|nr:hypothetical protein [Saprospiraceae bacterium]
MKYSHCHQISPKVNTIYGDMNVGKVSLRIDKAEAGIELFQMNQIHSKVLQQ